MDLIISFWSGLMHNREFMKYVMILFNIAFPIYVFVACSRYSLREIADEIQQKWKLIIKVIALTALIIPLVAVAVVKGLNVNYTLAVIMLIASTAPGDPFDLVETSGKKGNLLLAAALMAVLALTMPLTVPCWMWIFGQWFDLKMIVAPLGIFHAVGSKMIPPLILGVFCHWLFPNFTVKVADILHKIFIIVAGLLVILFLPAAINHIIFRFGLNGIIAMIIVTTFTAAAGYFLGAQDRQDRIGTALVVSLGNVAAVLFVTVQCLPKMMSLDFFFTVLGWIIVRWAIIWGCYFLMKHIMKVKGQTV